jgi:hypothetical protein
VDLKLLAAWLAPILAVAGMICFAAHYATGRKKAWLRVVGALCALGAVIAVAYWRYL